MTYYHGTEKKNLDSIFRSGLDPSYCWDIDEPQPVVFLSDNRYVARSFAPGGDNFLDPDSSKAVLLAINVPEEMEKQFVFDLGEFIRVPFIIPAEYITVVE